ncbi:MAG: MGMT family protein, partial [Bacillota bacterium]
MAARARYLRLETPIGPVYVAYTEKGALFVSLTARSDRAFDREARERFGGRLELLEPDGLPAGGSGQQSPEARRWQAALSRWFAEGKVPPLDLRWVRPFERKVMEAVRAIPRGEVRSYGQVARGVGRPGASRAVGQVMARNPLPLFVPCHRVVRSDGALGQYSGGGAAVKAALLELEGYTPPSPRRPK